MRDHYWRACAVLRVVDGDTVDLEIDLGFRTYAEHRVRLLGIDAPELRGPRAQPVPARAAMRFADDWLREHAPHGGGRPPHRFAFNLRSEKADSFGRYLGLVECRDGHSLTEALLEAGHARRWGAVK